MTHPSAKPTNETTELAKERSRQAAERTLTSWINTSLLLIGLGIGTEEIATALQGALPRVAVEIHLALSYALSLGTIAFGIALLVPISIAHQSELRALKQNEHLTPSHGLLYRSLVTGSVILFGLIALTHLVLIISQRL